MGCTTMESVYERYWRILNMTRDYLRFGWKQQSEPVPGEIGSRPPFAPADAGTHGPEDGTAPQEGALPAEADRRVRAGSSPESEEIRETVRAEAEGLADEAVENLSPEERRRRLDELARRVMACTRCRLSQNRSNAVPGEGVLDPRVMIIGEAPGATEDKSGKPFVGRAGNYLDKWMAAINLSRDRDLFIGNVIKCRPPQNRDPFPDETATCIPYLQRQIQLIRPQAILTVGRISTHILTERQEGIGRLHGHMFTYMGLPLIPTYHPSGVLRNPQYRAPVWEDLKKLRALIEDHG